MQKIIFSLFIALFFSVTGFSQNDAQNAKQGGDLIKTFDNYSVILPNDVWRVTASTGNVEMIYGDRLDGFLRITQTVVADGETLSDVVNREVSQKLQFKPGFVNGEEKSFAGNLSGKVANYEYTESGKAMIGRVYFLQDGKDVYVLRFTGLRDKLKVIRNQTDSIARTFKLKK